MNSLTKIAKRNSIEATTAEMEATEAAKEATTAATAEMTAAAMEMEAATTMLALTAATATIAHTCIAKRAIQNTKNDNKHKIVDIFSSNFDRLARFLIVN